MNKPNNKMTVKLADFKNGSWTREKWFGIGPFAVTINDADKSLTLEMPDHDLQILPVQNNQFGDFYQAKAFGGVAFIDILESQQFGTYARIKFRDGVQLPDTVLKSMAGPAKPQGNYSKPQTSGPGFNNSSAPRASSPKGYSPPAKPAASEPRRFGGTPAPVAAPVAEPAAAKPAGKPAGKRFGSNG